MPEAFTLHANKRHGQGTRSCKRQDFQLILVKKIEEIFGDLNEVGIDLIKLEEVQHGKQQYRLLRSTVSYTIRPPTGTLVGS
jgi:hypothetical protein